MALGHHPGAISRQTQDPEKWQANHTQMGIIAGLEDRWPNSFDLDDDKSLPESHPTSGSSERHRWQCDATQRQMG